MSYVGNTPEAMELKRLADTLEAATKDAVAAAKTANESASSAKRSAFWTMIAAFVSLFGIIIGVVSTLGWLDDLKREAKVVNKLETATPAALDVPTPQAPASNTAAKTKK